MELSGDGWSWVEVGARFSNIDLQKRNVSTLKFKRRMIDINILFEKEMT